MKTLIIYAHPNTPGHCPAIFDEVKSQLKQMNKEFEVLDLYKMKYDPVLHENEHYTCGNREVSKENKEIQEKISNTDKLVFIYPVWWNSMPAIMKGFLDKVFTARYAFAYEGHLIPRKLLKGKKASVFITTGSPPILFHTYFGSRAAKIIKRDSLGFFGIKAKVFYLGNARTLDEGKHKKIEKLARKGLKYLY
jgi:NAD(P)H dehydrogenase (quinone)